MWYPSSALFAGAVAGLIIVFFVIGIGVYILEAFAFYKMFQKAGVNHAWLAFIPIASCWPLMWTIKKSAWNILWILVPIANVVFLIIWQYRLFKAFRVSPWWLLLYIAYIIPGISYLVGIAFLVLYCYMGFSKITYNPNFDSPGGNSGGFTA